MSSAVWYADVNFLGAAGAISAGVIEGADGLVVVDPGPATSLAGLRDALAARGRQLQDIRAILVTHIHLDHSGGVGTLAREVPALRVFVHERGAPHVIDPSRLLASARRVYGDRMNRLWGEVAPVPASHVEVLEGDEALDLIGRPVRVAYTPGHAVHHVAYLDELSGVALCGDVAGMALAGTSCALPPTPPPDIDLGQWQASLARIRAWQPHALLLAHFGIVTRVSAHLDELEARLLDYADLVRDTLEREDDDDADRIERFREGVLADLGRSLPPAQVEEVERAYLIENSWHGLARYWKRRWERERSQ